MKEKLKKFWEWLKDFLSFSIDLILIVAALFLIPFGLNYLLETYPNIKALFGEAGIGEILTYLSTTFLAFLALYQNNRFRKLNRKHEQEQKAKDKAFQKLLADKDAEMQERMAAQNKEAQDRIAKLTSRANELTIKSQIINAEINHIENFDKYLSEFYSLCEPEAHNSLKIAYENNPEELIKKADIQYRHSNAAYQLLTKEMVKSPSEWAVDFQNVINDFYHASEEAYQELCNFHKFNIKNYSSQISILDTLSPSFAEYQTQYWTDLVERYNKLVYSNLSLEEIYSLFPEIKMEECLSTVRTIEETQKLNRTKQ